MKTAKQLGTFEKAQLFEKSLQYLKGKSLLDFSAFDAAIASLVQKTYLKDL